MRIPIADEIANCRQAIGNRVLGNHFAIHTNAFSKSDEVRGREQAAAISLYAQDRIDHRANGAFAIGTGDVNDCAAAKIETQRGEKSFNIFQAELDPEALEAIKPGERLAVVHGAMEK